MLLVVCLFGLCFAVCSAVSGDVVQLSTCDLVTCVEVVLSNFECVVHHKVTLYS